MWLTQSGYRVTSIPMLAAVIITAVAHPKARSSGELARKLGRAIVQVMVGLWHRGQRKATGHEPQSVCSHRQLRHIMALQPFGG